jgi:hypothetical protein
MQSFSVQELEKVLNLLDCMESKCFVSHVNKPCFSWSSLKEFDDRSGYVAAIVGK